MSIWNPQTEAELTRLWNKNTLSCLQIAKRFGIGKNAVIGKAHRMGLGKKTFYHNSWNSENTAMLMEMVDSGCTQTAICKRLGLAPVTVRTKMRALGMPPLVVRTKKPNAKKPNGSPKKMKTPEPEPIGELFAEPGCCRYPHGEPKTPEYRVCGHPIKSGSVYCAWHHDLCHIEYVWS